MNINIRDYIKNNFKNSSIDELKDSIISSTQSNDEVVLPGLGVLFEILWINSSNNEQENIINIIFNNIKK